MPQENQNPETSLMRDDDDASRLHREATDRLAQAAQGDRASIGFARQMIQLILIPALIVGVIMGVWMLLIMLGGQAQSLEAIVAKLESAGGGPPAYQERSRAALALMSHIESGELSEEEFQLLHEKMPAIVRLHREGGGELSRALMVTFGRLGNPGSIPIFREYLESESPEDHHAAVGGLYRWGGAMSDVTPLVPLVVQTLDEQDLTIRLFAVSIIGAAASPNDHLTREALVRQMERSSGENRDVAWNAGCALAVLGDERGLPTLLSMLDRAWLATQPSDPTRPDSPPLSVGAQDKVLATAINVVVGFDPFAGGHKIRIVDPQVWQTLEALAESDPSPTIRELAASVLTVRSGDDGG